MRQPRALYDGVAVHRDRRTVIRADPDAVGAAAVVGGCGGMRWWVAGTGGRRNPWLLREGVRRDRLVAALFDRQHLELVLSWLERRHEFRGNGHAHRRGGIDRRESDLERFDDDLVGHDVYGQIREDPAGWIGRFFGDGIPANGQGVAGTHLIVRSRDIGPGRNRVCQRRVTLDLASVDRLALELIAALGEQPQELIEGNVEE